MVHGYCYITIILYRIPAYPSPWNSACYIMICSSFCAIYVQNQVSCCCVCSHRHIGGRGLCMLSLGCLVPCSFQGSLSRGVFVSGSMFLLGSLNGQRIPRTETPRTEIPLDRDPLDGDPLDRDPWTETPLLTETALDRDPWTETPLDRDPPPDREPPPDRDPPGQRPPDRDPSVQ